MRSAQDMTYACGEWLECDSSRRALIEARPDIASGTVLDPQRPMLRILRPEGDVVVRSTGLGPRRALPHPWQALPSSEEDREQQAPDADHHEHAEAGGDRLAGDLALAP